MRNPVLLFTILLSVFSVSIPAQEQTWSYKDWNVAAEDGLIRYFTRGSVVNGHKLGFVKQAGECDIDLLIIEWSNNRPLSEDLEGTDATLRFRVGKEAFPVDTRVRAVYNVNPLLTLVMFSDFVAGPPLINLFKKEDRVDVELVSYTDDFDITKDQFSLVGYTAALLKAKEICESMTADQALR